MLGSIYPIFGTIVQLFNKIVSEANLFVDKMNYKNNIEFIAVNKIASKASLFLVLTPNYWPPQ